MMSMTSKSLGLQYNRNLSDSQKWGKHSSVPVYDDVVEDYLKVGHVVMHTVWK